MIVTPKDYNPLKKVYILSQMVGNVKQSMEYFLYILFIRVSIRWYKSRKRKEEAFLIEELFNMGII